MLHAELKNLLNEFPATSEEAQQRYEATEWHDPFPEIAPALLNSADLLDYINKTGMIWPFRPDLDHLGSWIKPASCAIAARGKYIRWESRDSPADVGELDLGQTLIIKPNSIVYVTLEPEFRIPPYIAARFNLKIKSIYKGFLVGTGPLVDPGFNGRLSIPLHNLTANTYPLVGGKPLVWMEFTKLSPNTRWTSAIPEPSASRKGVFIEFPKWKSGVDVVKRVEGAWHEPIVSSIPEQMSKAGELAQSAGEAAEKAEANVAAIRTRASRLGWLALAGLTVSLVAIVLSVYSLINDVQTDLRIQRNENSVAKQEIERMSDRLESQRRSQRQLERKLSRISE